VEGRGTGAISSWAGNGEKPCNWHICTHTYIWSGSQGGGTYRVRRMSDYTLKNGYNRLICGRSRLYICSYAFLGYDTYNMASQMFVRTLEIRYALTYLLCLEIGCAHLKILQLQFSAYTRHYIDLNSSPIDQKSLSAYIIDQKSLSAEITFCRNHFLRI
jgi:hypothetical protein